MLPLICVTAAHGRRGCRRRGACPASARGGAAAAPGSTWARGSPRSPRPAAICAPTMRHRPQLQPARELTDTHRAQGAWGVRGRVEAALGNFSGRGNWQTEQEGGGRGRDRVEAATRASPFPPPPPFLQPSALGCVFPSHAPSIQAAAPQPTLPRGRSVCAGGWGGELHTCRSGERHGGEPLGRAGEGRGGGRTRARRGCCAPRSCSARRACRGTTAHQSQRRGAMSWRLRVQWRHIGRAGGGGGRRRLCIHNATEHTDGRREPASLAWSAAAPGPPQHCSARPSAAPGRATAPPRPPSRGGCGCARSM